MRDNASFYIDKVGRLRIREASSRADGLVTPETARHEQTGGNQGLVALIIGGLALAFVLRQTGLDGDGEQPGPGNGTGGAEVRNLGVDFGGGGAASQAQAGFAARQIDVEPLSIHGLTGYTFQYRGPANTLQLGWGIKPDVGFFGANWNNGGNLIQRPFRAWNSINVPVSASVDFATFQQNFVGGTQASIAIPDPAVQQINRAGDNVGLNFGSADVWVWLAVATTQLQGLMESNQLVIDTDANVFNILAPSIPSAAGQALNVVFG